MSTNAVKAGEAFVRLGIRDQLSAGLDLAKRKLATWAISLRNLGLGATGLATTLLTPLALAVQQFAEQGSRLDDLAQQTGTSAESLSALSWAAKMAGVELTTLNSALIGLAKFTAQVSSGGKKAVDLLKKLGISSAEFLVASPEVRLMLIAEGLRTIEDPGLRAAFAMRALGKAGVGLLPLLKDGAAGIQRFVQEARELGIIVSGEEAQKAATLGDAFDRLFAVLGASTFQVGLALADSLTRIVDLLVAGAQVVRKFVANNQQLIVVAAGVALGLLAVGAGLLGLAALSAGLSLALGAVNTALAVGAALWSILLTLKAARAAADALILGLLSANVVALTAEGLAALWASIQTGLLTAATVALEAVLSVLLSPLFLIVAGLALLAAGLAYATYAFFAFTTIGQTALSLLGEMFRDLWSIATQSVKGIFDAILAGRWDLAAKVVGAGMRVAWEQVVFSLKALWSYFKEWLIGLFFDLIAQLANQLAQFVNGFVALFNDLRTSLGLDPIKIEFANQFAKDAQGAAKLAKQSLKMIRQGEIREAQKRVTKAQEELDQATGEEAQARAAEAEKRQADLDYQVQPSHSYPASSAASVGYGSLGTFSAAVAGLLGRSGPDNAAERTANATESIDGKLDEVIDAIEEGGLFAT